MATGTVTSVVHLSQASYLSAARLVSGHNEKGYGIIAAADGLDIYFPHDAVQGYDGFNELRKGQRVEYSAEPAPYQNLALSVRLLI